MSESATMKVVILCGGKGTRSYPFTDHFPKALMPIGGTPIIVHLMGIYARQGITDFVLAAGHRQETLRDYFDGRFSEWTVDVVDTGEETDTGDRVRRCESRLGDTFMVTYGDGLGDVDMRQLLDFHRDRGGVATVTSVPLRSQYGTIGFSESNRVEYFREKPVLREYWINAGFLVFNKSVFDHWTGTSLEGDVLPSLASRGALFTYQHEGFWKSMDTSKDQSQLEDLYRSDSSPWIVNGNLKKAHESGITSSAAVVPERQ